MIPKILHFIWIGHSVPSYALTSMNAFKSVNPKFDVNFMHIQDEKMSSDDDLNCVIAEINTPNTLFNKFFNQKWNKQYLTTANGKRSGLVDCLKYFILDKYGGIYLDLDTFPVRPFDDTLLNTNQFIVQPWRDKTDHFFIGSVSGKALDGTFLQYDDCKQEYVHGQCKRISYPDDLRKKYHINVNVMTKMFKRGTIEYGMRLFPESITDYYIDHYKSNEWKK